MLSEKSTIQAYRVAYFIRFAVPSRHDNMKILTWHEHHTGNPAHQIDYVLRKMKEYDDE